MEATISPSVISGTIQAPASKSSMQRACAAALLHEGETLIFNPGTSEDDLAALGVIKSLGAQLGDPVVKNGETFIIIKSTGLPAGSQINCGESGLGIRMFTPIAALSTGAINITGKGSLLTRPMGLFDELFPKLGVAIRSNNGKLPLTIRGPLQPAAVTIDGSTSSQFLTGLLFAFGKAAVKPVTITVNNLKSKPYIDLTLKVMEQFGYSISHNNYRDFVIEPKKTTSDTRISYTVEGDWSGAAFLMVAGAIAGETAISGLDVHSAQADKSILEALKLAGAIVSIENKKLTITSSELNAFHFDATDCPDLFPPLVALAAYCKGDSTITGVSRLAFKESNRGITLQSAFAKMGVTIALKDDLMLVTGGGRVRGAVVRSQHDHRIAMATAVAALGAAGDTTINDAEAINKSYPDFYKHLKMLNAGVSLVP